MLSTKCRDNKVKQARLLHSQWLNHLEHCAQSHLSAKEYCVQHGLSLKGLKRHDWLERRKQKQRSGDFALIKVVSEPISVVSHYEIVFPRGVALRVPTSSSLSAILKSLECYL
jgi:hypothetical protein